MAARLSTTHTIALTLWLLAAGGAQAQIRFEDTAGKTGPKFQLRNGASGKFHQPELMLGGVAALDYNNDGCMDIFFTNGAEMPSLKKSGPEFSNRLFRNDCHGAFHRRYGKSRRGGRRLLHGSRGSRLR